MAKVLCVLLTAIVPGAGHLMRRQYLRASALLFLFVAALDIYAAKSLLGDEDVQAWLSWWSVLAMSVVWVVAMAHVVYLCFIFDEAGHRKRVDELFKKGQEDYLRGEHATALEAFRRGVRLDPEDSDLRFYLGLTYRALGRIRPAKRAFRKCRGLDEDGKWSWDIGQALQSMKSR